MNAVLEVRDLRTGYGALTAVNNASLSLHPGEVVAIFGANGAGKSSTLLSIVGNLPRQAGTVTWAGKPAPRTVHAMARAGLAFVPEERSIIRTLSTRDNLRLGSGGVKHALSYFPELEEHLDRSAGLLSGGQQQLVMLARALATRPKALLVDELSLGLAPLVVDRLWGALRKAADTEGTAALVVEQQTRRALESADRWYLMASGSVGAEGRCDAEGAAALERIYLSRMGIQS